ncbi:MULTISPECIES: LytR/AlgR family response regulator transcription factor [Halopseudomonas]|jgi:two-component system response regulator AlgR|uniref:Two component transcriptional regulator, LytTR family n=1 Tax=Halopseudomonas aestusnigri TaxID=857252 RepID=A0AAQ1G852_9GAMM|nr:MULTISPECIES: LytTR family DNA-binding domain-containing protein [Halopseudomonas]MAH00507.1 DNA-binding response regulator [Pseudomonadales bacterium]MEE2799839.1 LytTR family DNA-binding domain-containing protein [Pseudomonadota bacterium]HBT57714.1 DNA-binding response regulator [Pseudomonas sp.]MAK73649.1 DNA-binding response regulator [Pseudomonadales bacterium]MAP77038.1 DNA-binding response regulator [Pseudomonadales bacterium]|tara:strand:+ start:3042 stop:3791 length:750 start_codon:yes stop_codon:yes gene_type:complete
MKVLIADDEPLARERLARLVGSLPGYKVLPEMASNGHEALQLVQEHHPDIVLLDIRMPGLDGLQTAAKLCESPEAPAVVFCTAHGEYALDAFAVSAVGYLLKPVRSEALEEALAKAQRPNRMQLASLGKATASGDDMPARSHISARTRKGIELIPIEDVLYFIADHKYVTLRHVNGEVLLDEPLKALEEEFGDRFVRIHRNALVARSRIECLQRTSMGHFELCLKDLEGETLTVSRRHVPGVRRLMDRL